MKKSDFSSTAPPSSRPRAPPQGAGKAHVSSLSGDRPSAGPASRPATALTTSRTGGTGIRSQRPSSASQIYRTPEPRHQTGASAPQNPNAQSNNNSSHSTSWHRRPGSTAVGGKNGPLRPHRAGEIPASSTGTSLTSQHASHLLSPEQRKQKSQPREVYDASARLKPPIEKLQPVDKHALRPSSASSLRPSSAGSLRPSSAGTGRPRLRPASAMSSSQASKQTTMKRFRLTDCKPIDQNLLVLMGGRAGPAGATSDNVASLSIHKSRLWIGNLQPLPNNTEDEIGGLIPHQRGPLRQQLFVRLRPNNLDSVPTGTGEDINMARFEEAIGCERRLAFQSQQALEGVKDQLCDLIDEISSFGSSFREFSSAVMGDVDGMEGTSRSLDFTTEDRKPTSEAVPMDTAETHAKIKELEARLLAQDFKHENKAINSISNGNAAAEAQILNSKIEELEAEISMLKEREGSLISQTEDLQTKLAQKEAEVTQATSGTNQSSEESTKELEELRMNLAAGRDEVLMLMDKLSVLEWSQSRGVSKEELQQYRAELMNAKSQHEKTMMSASAESKDLIMQLSEISNHALSWKEQMIFAGDREQAVETELEVAKHQLELLMDHFRQIRALLKRVLDDDDMHDSELDAMSKQVIEKRFGRRVSQESVDRSATPNDAEDPAESLYKEAMDLALCMHESMSKLYKSNTTAQKELEHHRKGLAQEGLLSKVNEANKQLQKTKEEAEKQVKAAQDTVQHQINLAVIKAHGKFELEKTQLLEELAVVYNNHGSALKKSGDSMKAMEMFKKALQARSKASGDDALDLAPIMINLAAVKLQQNQLEEAEPLFTKAYELRRKELGEQDKHTVAAKKWLDKCKKAQAQAVGSNSTPHTADFDSVRSEMLSSIGSVADQVMQSSTAI